MLRSSSPTRQPGQSASVPALLCALGLAILSFGAALVAAVASIKAPHAGTLVALAGAATLLWAFTRWSADDRQTPWMLGAALLVGLGLRLAALPLADGIAFDGDPTNYANLARAVMAGQGLVVDDVQYGDGLRAHFPPLYPLLLAGVWSVFGDHGLVTMGFAFACDIVAAAALLDLARRFGHDRAGRLAAVLLLLAPSLILGAPVPQKESLTVLLAVLLIRAMLVWQAARPTGAQHRHVLLTGLWWGLVSLAQPSLALLAPLVGLSFVPRRGLVPVVRFGFLAGLVAILVLLPWWVRNWLVFDRFVAFTTAAGYLVNVQLGPNRLPFPEGLFALPEAERGSVMARAALSWIAAHPLEHAASLAHGIAKVFTYDEAAISAYRTGTPPLAAGTQAWMTASVQWLWAGLLAAAALGSRTLPATSGLHWLAPLFLTLIIGMVATTLWFEFAERHRYVLSPLLAWLAALWLVRSPQPAQQ